MLKKYLVPIVMAFTISFSIATAEAPFISLPEAQNSPVVTRNDINEIINRKAFVYGVNADLMRYIVNCESRYKIDAVNINSREESYGLVQINLLAHTHISIEEATTPEFAIDFLARHIENGKVSRMWITCYDFYKQGVQLR